MKTRLRSHQVFGLFPSGFSWVILVHCMGLLDNTDSGITCSCFLEIDFELVALSTALSTGNISYRFLGLVNFIAAALPRCLVEYSAIGRAPLEPASVFRLAV